MIRRPLLIALLCSIALSSGALAGSLTPPGAVASTMHSLTELYDSIAGTFDSTSIVANQNGSLIQQLKYIENNILFASGSNNIWTLNSGNVGIGDVTPNAKLHVAGDIIASGSSGNRFLKLKVTEAGNEDGEFTLRACRTVTCGINAFQILGSASQIFMSISSSGNVGIGSTINPTANLLITGGASGVTASISNSNNARFELISSTTRALYVIADAGNMARVGIGGTKTPDEALDVTGNIVASSSGNPFFKLKVTESGNEDSEFSLRACRTISCSGLSLFQILGSASQAFLSIASSGNVGINTAAPAGLLDIKARADTHGSPFIVRAGNNSVRASISFDGTNGHGSFALFDSSGARNVLLSSNTASSSYVMSGNFGIGIATPISPLDISNASESAITFSRNDTTVTANDLLGRIDFWNNDTQAATNIFARIEGRSENTVGTGLTGAAGYLSFYTASTTLNEVMRITKAGNVGIGTTLPQGKLQVTGSASTDTNIGTALPVLVLKNFDTGSENLVPIEFRNGYNCGQTCNIKLARIAALGAWDGTGPSGTLIFATKIGYATLPSEKMRITNVGRVGININNPGTMLDVYGSGSVDPFNVASSSGSSILRITKGGNVGINDTTPDALFDVEGAASISGNFGIETTGFYYNATSNNVGIGTKNVDARLEIFGSSVTTGTVASISGTALTTGNVLSLRVPTSASQPGVDYLVIRDTSGQVYASLGAGGELTLRRNIFNHGAIESCTAANNPVQGCIDYAESFSTTDPTLSAGEVVSVDPSNPSGVIRAGPNTAVLGIVSTNPAVLIDGNALKSGGAITISPGYVPIALSGRVPVKISDENGPILPGDHLTTSQTRPGYAMKQTAPGMSIGISLGDTMVFVNLGYWAPDLGSIPMASAASPSQPFGYSTFSDLFGAIVAAFKDLLGIGFEQGRVKTQELCLDDLCVNKQQLREILQQTNATPVPSPSAEVQPQETPEATPTPSETPMPSEEPSPSTGPSPQPLAETP